MELHATNLSKKHATTLCHAPECYSSQKLLLLTAVQRAYITVIRIYGALEQAENQDNGIKANRIMVKKKFVNASFFSITIFC